MAIEPSTLLSPLPAVLVIKYLPSSTSPAVVSVVPDTIKPSISSKVCIVGAGPAPGSSNPECLVGSVPLSTFWYICSKVNILVESSVGPADGLISPAKAGLAPHAASNRLQTTSHRQQALSLKPEA